MAVKLTEGMVALDEVWIAVALSGLAALLAAIAAFRPRAGSEPALALLSDTVNSLSRDLQTLRTALSDDLRRSRDEAEMRGRSLREEAGNNFRDGFARSDDGMRALRTDVQNLFKVFGEVLTGSVGQLSTAQAEKLDAVASQVSTLGDANERRLSEMRKDGEENGKALREEVARQLQVLGATIAQHLTQSAETQKERLDGVANEIRSLSQRSGDAHEGLRTTLEGRLDLLRQENAGKLEEMRRTVDEKLQGTLEQRLNASFKLVSDQLEQVFKSVGEMQSLATGVGDLKRVLTNVKTRGTWAEVSLGVLLDQVMAPEQYGRNVEVKPGSGERVEFAIKLPGQIDGDKPVWLPIDAKFPNEDYERLIEASERADTTAIDLALKGLEQRIKREAELVCGKYVSPPHSTDFAILYLPTEGLYAEVIRRPGLVDDLQRKCRIVVAGPTVLLAILNSLRMGFRTLAIQKRSSEVWQVLAAIKTEFTKYGAVLDKVQKKLGEASKTIEDVSVRRRAIDRKLKGVETLPEIEAERLLSFDRSLGETELLDAAE